MQLSVVIVSYNVRFFLEQCLSSVYAALKDISGEVWVVDNASTDGSVEMVKTKFPDTKLIANTNNLGFSRANNLAIKQATGKYILLLNPDTIVQEETFIKCINFMESHPNAGGLTVKMIDGKGRYLPESKRGFPSPWSSFCKIFGFTSLFPHSKRFAGYYLGHLSINATHEIEILPGAFMFLRTETLNRVGLLDEQFFLYGEDIDLSYRITLAGYNNFYYPECQIVHYKGESTKKGSLNYVVIFYKAMILFAQKHLSKKRARLFIALIKVAVIMRASISAIKRIMMWIWLPMFDILVMFLGTRIIVPWWEKFRLGATNLYPKNILTLLLGFYILSWLIALWIAGAYDKPQPRSANFKGTIWGMLFILVIYSVLPQNFRFSRAIILLLGAWTALATFAIRSLTNWVLEPIYKPNSERRNILFIGTSTEFKRSKNILQVSGIRSEKITLISPSKVTNQLHQFIPDAIVEIINANRISEIVFGTEAFPMASIVQAMHYLSQFDIDFKIALHSGDSIVGSNSINTQGELYSLEIKALGKPQIRRIKRLFDISSSLLLIITFPLCWPFLKKPLWLTGKAFKVLLGLSTWIGYHNHAESTNQPKLKKCVFAYGSQNLNGITAVQLNSQYARNYSLKTDLNELLRNILK